MCTHAYIYVCVCVCVQSSLTFVTPWTVVCQAPLYMEFSRHEYWSGSPFPIPQDLPNTGIETVSLASPALVGRFFTAALPGKWSFYLSCCRLQSLVVGQFLNHVLLFVTPWTAAHQACLSFTISQSLLRLVSTESWCRPTVSSSVAPVSSCLSFFLTSGSFPMSWLFPSVLEFQLQHQSFQWTFRIDFLQDWLVWFPCSPRDSQEFSSEPQFKSINSSVFSLLYGPTLTSVHDHWKNHSFDHKDLCRQSNVSAY